MRHLVAVVELAMQELSHSPSLICHSRKRCFTKVPAFFLFFTALIGAIVAPIIIATPRCPHVSQLRSGDIHGALSCTILLLFSIGVTP